MTILQVLFGAVYFVAALFLFSCAFRMRGSLRWAYLIAAVILCIGALLTSHLVTLPFLAVLVVR
jgi:hypothetical protein